MEQPAELRKYFPTKWKTYHDLRKQGAGRGQGKGHPKKMKQKASNLEWHVIIGPDYHIKSLVQV
jgi:hypothetical protein